MQSLLPGDCILETPMSCSDAHAACPRWASDGHCDELSDFMDSECALSCGRCDGAASADVDPCEPVPDAVGPGAISSAFATAAAMGRFSPRMVSDDPPVVVLDEFVGRDEAAEIAALSESVGFRASGSSCGHKELCNSASVSCVPMSGGDCWAHRQMRELENRMLQVLQVPATNCEPLRFFRYFEGETFGLHHDAEGQIFEADTVGGPRVWTLYVFLSEPEGGGGHFNLPRLNVSIAPKVGRAVLWPHLRDDDLMTPDERTAHEGAPVGGGVKYGVNLHAHRNNVRTRVLAGCSGGVGGIAHVFDYETTVGNSPLHDAVGFGATAAARSLLAAGAAAAATDATGITPLHLAAGRGLVAAARACLEAGAPTEQPDRSGATPLHMSAWRGEAAVARLLLDAGANADAATAQGVTPLMLAAKHGHAEAAQALLDNGAAIEAASGRGSTALHMAARAGKAQLARLLLRAGADVGAADAGGQTPLHVAAAEGRADAARALVEEGGDDDVGRRALLEAADAGRATPLHHAALRGDATLARLLLEAGASADSRGPRDATPLEVAVARGHAEVAALLQVGAAVAGRGGGDPRQGRTPIAVALLCVLLAAALRWVAAIRRGQPQPPRGTGKREPGAPGVG